MIAGRLAAELVPVVLRSADAAPTARRAGSASCRPTRRRTCRRRRWNSCPASRARARRPVRARSRRCCGSTRGVEPIIAQLTQQYTQLLPEEHERRVAAVALGVRPREGVHGGVPDRAEGGLSARGQQALARDPAVGDRAARALPRPRRQVPALPLQPLDPGAVARVPRALRVRAHARLAARAARLRRRRVRASRASRSSRST